MLDLRGTCRPCDIGESGIDKDRTGAKHEKQEKLTGFIRPRRFIPKNTIWSSARFVMEKENYPGTLLSLMFAEAVEVLDSLEMNLKFAKGSKIESK